MRIQAETWPVAGSFTIARGARTEVHVVTVSLQEGEATGRGECVPYARYGESVESVCAQLEAVRGQAANGLDRNTLQKVLPAGAARNALDCALWDLEAKLAGRCVAEMLGMKPLDTVTTAYTISLGTPEKMAEQAGKHADRDLLKVKLGGDGDMERMYAVREAAPNTRLILDANEAWQGNMLEPFLEAAAKTGAEVVEQPLPVHEDDLLAAISRPVPVCADESVHTRDGLETLRAKFDCINIKLDKAGGLTEALELHKAARQLEFAIMVGCMVGTSLAMAPALLLAQDAEFVDLDGPLLLAHDRENGLDYPGSLVSPPLPELWG